MVVYTHVAQAQESDEGIRHAANRPRCRWIGENHLPIGFKYPVKLAERPLRMRIVMERVDTENVVERAVFPGQRLGVSQVDLGPRTQTLVCDANHLRGNVDTGESQF